MLKQKIKYYIEGRNDAGEVVFPRFPVRLNGRSGMPWTAVLIAAENGGRMIDAAGEFSIAIEKGQEFPQSMTSCSLISMLGEEIVEKIDYNGIKFSNFFGGESYTFINGQEITFIDWDFSYQSNKGDQSVSKNVSKEWRNFQI